MKPVMATIFSTAGNVGVTNPDQTSESEIRQRRDAERARLRRHQNDRHQHAEAESRLADAMALASARNVQLARSTRPGPDPLPMSVVPDFDSVSVPVIDNQPTRADPSPSVSIVDDARVTGGELDHPVTSLLQRLARGQSRGLLQDCAPMLDSIAVQLANRSPAMVDSSPAQYESLACALDFLQGYADAATSRVPGADELVRRLNHIRLQLEAILQPQLPSTGVNIEAGHPQAEQGSAIGRAARSVEQRENINIVRKNRAGRTREVKDDPDDQDGLSPASIAGAAASAAGVQANVLKAAESSLDKDQRQRRDDTLPLVTLRSI